MKSDVTKVAIIGLGCWYPGASNPRELWENILARRRQFRLMPDVRLPLAEYHDVDRTVPDKTYGSMVAVVDGYDFDWSKHRIPKSAYEATDLAHWLALDVALQMLQDAGYSSEKLPSASTQVIVGNSLTGEFTRSNTLRLRWPFVDRALKTSALRQGLGADESARLSKDMEQEFKAVFPPVTEDSLAGGLANTIAGRICNYLNLNGGGYTVDGACSSSLIAIYSGATHLANGSTDFVIAGGVDISLDPFELVGFAKTGALTPNEMSVYDKRGNGFIPGEGCGFVGMKRLEDARRDGDKVYALLDGWGMSSDGKGGITAPSVHGQSLALQRAYARAGISPDELDFIEGHGTGTAVGDRTELLGIAKALAGSGTGRKRSCGVTSLKSVIGHTKAAAGIGAFIKAVMAVNQRVLPPTAGCTRPHDVFTRDAEALYPLIRGAVLAPDREVRAGVSAMGFGGINVHVTLASADPAFTALKPGVGEQAALTSAQDCEVICLSATSEQDLLARLEELRLDVGGASLAELTDLAASVNQRSDPRHPFRASLVASTPRELGEKVADLEASLRAGALQSGGISADSMKLIAASRGSGRSRIGFVFPGQGSQQTNMARPLLERFEWARTLVANSDRWASELGTEELAASIYAPADRLLERSELDAVAERLRDTRLAQPAIVLASLIWVKYLSKLGIEAAAVLGHSLGELSAFFAAGAFDERAALRLATVRGQLMAAQDAESGGAMLSLSCNRADAEDAIAEVASQGVLVVANVNSGLQTVASGDSRSIETLREVAKRRGIRAQPLRVSNAFHSPLVASAASGIRGFAALAKRPVRVDKVLISSCDGRLISPEVDLSEHFAQQVVTPVDFVAGLSTLRAHCDWIIEVGPGRALSGLIEQAGARADSPSLAVESTSESFRDLNWVVAVAHVMGTPIHWDQLYSNRVVRPFRAARELQFIVNPCERGRAMAPAAAAALLPKASAAPPVAALVAAPRAAPGSANGFAILAERTANLTGFALSSIHSELRLTDDLNLDSIKISALIGETCLALGVDVPENPAALAVYSLGEIALRLAASATNGHEALLVPTPHAPVAPGVPGPVPQATTAAQARPASAVEAILLDLAARHTGFDRNTLDANASLTDDLNLDSIKIAALLSEAEAVLEINAALGPADVANATINQIALRLAGFRADAPPVAPSVTQPAVASPVQAAPAAPMQAMAHTTEHASSAVSSFAMKLVPSQLETADSWQFTGSVVAIQCDTDERPLAAVLSARFESLGAKVVTLDATELLSDPRTDFNRLLVILPRCVSSKSGGEALVASSVQRLRAAAVVSARQRNCESLTYVQFGGLGYSRSGSSTSFSTACASAFAASIHLERPMLRVRVLDFHPGQDASSAASRVMDEQRGRSGYVLSHYDREQRRYEQEPVVLRTELEPPRPIGWNNRDVVLVTGGARGITAECALAFARATQVRLVLVGSSPLPTLGDNSEIAQTLSRCAAAGVFARYYQCDIVDRGAVVQLIEHVRREYGTISGVIHGAGLNRPRRVEQVEESAAVTEVSPKLIGLLNLCEILRASPPKLFVGMSSIIGVTGMPGNAWYAFSNEAANACLARFRAFHPDTAVVSLAYSVWSDIGMAAKMGSEKHLAKLGVTSLSPAVGVASFLDATLRDAGALQVVVAGSLGGLDTWRAPAMPAPRGGRFLENLISFEPGVEVIARSKLTLEDDLYLNDHYFRGVYLFPTVFGLEAMAQAVAKVAGITAFQSLRVLDVGLTRPIIVSSDKGAEIQVRARVVSGGAQGQSGGAQGQPLRVQVGIAVDQTGFRRDHFSATFLLESPTLPGGGQLQRLAQSAALDLDPKRDLYGGLLFQGPLFQVLDRVWRMDSSGSLTRARHAKSEHYFSSAHAQTLLLGDPLLRDALLQSAQLSEKCTVLPIGIDELQLFDLARPDAQHALINNELVTRTESGPSCTVFAEGQDGNPIERLVGYRLKQMDHNDSAAEPEDWANPTRRDSATLLGVLARHCERFELSRPDCSLTFVPHLPSLERAERRPLEAPLLLQVGKVALGGRPTRQLEVGWREDGKPLFVGVATDELDVSLSHDGSLCLCVAGPGSQGCDVQAVESMSRVEWLRLVGAEHAALLDQLLEAGESLEEAGTRLWCALETLTKAYGMRRLAALEKQDDAVLFTPQMAAATTRVLTFSVPLTRPPKRMFALLVRPQRAVSAQAAWEVTTLYEGSDGARRDGRDGGGHPELRHRFRSTFRDTAGARGGVKSATYADWMGTLRELSVASVAPELIADFASGRWGMVTNYSNVQIVRDVACLEQIEGRLRFTRAYGKFGSSIDMQFDWSRVGADGSLEAVARADMATTWVEIVGHGSVEVRPFPEYMDRLVKSYLVEPSTSELESPVPIAAEVSKLGPVIYSAPNAPCVKPELARYAFSTTSVESNLVGNIYYANYYRWQSETLERFLHGLEPSTKGAQGGGALSCTFCSVAHLREAMPFDQIEVVMALRGLYERGLELHFDFYKVQEGRGVKLATGQYQALWVGTRSNGVENLPRDYVLGLTQFLSVAAE